MKKRRIAITILCAAVAVLLVSACGASGADSAYTRDQSMLGLMNTQSDGGSMAYPQELAVAEMAPAPAPQATSMALYDADASIAGGSGITQITAPVTEGFNEKIIYSYYAEIETLKYDDTIAAVNTLIATHGAFIENSNMSGSNYASSYYGTSLRYAYFVIRVPVEQLNAVTAKLDTLGHVVSQSSNAQNITSQFVDNESRLNSLRIQEERLLEMLTKAEKIEDMLAIENSLSDVRYQIEWLTTTLNNWQRQVDYSTVTLSISEVEELTEKTPPHRTYWERMGDGLMSTLRGIGNFFTSVFMWIVVSAPVLIILAVIAVVAVIIIKVIMRKAKAKQAAKVAAYQQHYAMQQQAEAPPQAPVAGQGAQQAAEETDNA